MHCRSRFDYDSNTGIQNETCVHLGRTMKHINDQSSLGRRVERELQLLAKSPRLTVACATAFAFAATLKFGTDIDYFLASLTLVFLGIWMKDLFFTRRRLKKRRFAISRIRFPLVNRATVAARIADSILEHANRIQLVMGRSGSGKTLLVDNIIEQIGKRRIENNGVFLYKVINQYHSLETQAFTTLKHKVGPLLDTDSADTYLTEFEKKEGNLFLVVFDQLELLFAPELDERRRQLLREEFAHVVTLCKKYPAVRVLFVARSESASALCWDSAILPYIGDAILLDGISNQDSMLERSEFAGNVEALVFDSSLSELLYLGLGDRAAILGNDRVAVLRPDLSSHSRFVSPLEVATLSRAFAISRKFYGGALSPDEAKIDFAEVAIKRFFQYHLEAFDDAENGGRILYALSIDPQSRLTVHDIGEVTRIGEKQIMRSLSFFQRHGLVTEDHGGRWRWLHLYYALQFNRNGKSFLDLADRDEIYFRSKRRISSETPRHPISSKHLGTKETISIAVFAASLLLLLIRTLAPSIERFTALPAEVAVFLAGFMPSDGLRYTNVDAAFLPIAISLSFWSWYVTAFYRRILAKVSENTFLGTLFSGFVAGWSLVCVILSIRYPRYWISFTGLGGLIVGFKYYLLSLREDDLLNHRRLKQIGFKTMVNSAAMGIFFGRAYASMFSETSFLAPQYREANFLFGISLLMMGLMLYFAGSVIRDHVGEANIPSLIGDYVREGEVANS